MSLLSPSATISAFVAAMNRGDLESALECYAPDALFVAAPGQTLRDPDAIRESLHGMLSLKTTLETSLDTVLEAGDTALFHAAWTMIGVDPAGNDVRIEGRSSDVLRRQPDGNWKIAVDNPWGTAVLDAGR